jgi:hypothetical protein
LLLLLLLLGVGEASCNLWSRAGTGYHALRGPFFDDVARLIPQALCTGKGLYEGLGLYGEQTLLKAFIEKVIRSHAEDMLGNLINVLRRKVLDDLVLAIGDQFGSEVPHSTSRRVRKRVVHCSI